MRVIPTKGKATMFDSFIHCPVQVSPNAIIIETMKIKLNDKEIEIFHAITLEELLLKEINISYEKKGIAVAVNDSIIPKNEWKNYPIKENDEILIIIAAQGG